MMMGTKARSSLRSSLRSFCGSRTTFAKSMSMLMSMSMPWPMSSGASFDGFWRESLWSGSAISS